MVERVGASAHTETMSFETPPATLVDHLEAAARDGGGRTVFHRDGGAYRLEADELFEMARIRAARLRDAGVAQGDRVGIIGPNAPDWVAWAHAGWLLGATLVAVPIPLRVRDRAALTNQIGALATGFNCRRIAAHERFVPLVDERLVIPWDDVGSPADALALDDLVRIADDTLAGITPTSGSTSAPKGVSRSYAVLSLVKAIVKPSVNPLDREVVRPLSFAPLSHAAASMAILAALEPTLEFHLLSPERFARDPAELFRVVSEYRIMSLLGSSSAIAAALRSIERGPDGVDLSSIESINFAFEMVDPAVIDRLIEVGGRFGLRPEAIGASYGLSEGGGTRTENGQGIHVDEVDLDALVTQGVARPAAAGGPVKRVASCGRVSATSELRIAGPDGPMPDRHVGEVQFRGEWLMQGYVGPGAEDAFDKDGWMHTGDVGYLADGELFITGRIKEVIVQQGKKYHPEDIEWAAARGADVAPAECVAFTPLGADDGEIVVAVETSLTKGLEDQEQRIRAAVINSVGITLRAVVFVSPATLPKASSGKSQRLAARDKHARGELDVVSR